MLTTTYYAAAEPGETLEIHCYTDHAGRPTVIVSAIHTRYGQVIGRQLAAHAWPGAVTPERDQAPAADPA